MNSSEACSKTLTRHIFCALGIDETNLLNLFSQGDKQRTYCHSHLVTVRDFDEGTVGLAWVGARSKFIQSYIASPPLFDTYWLFVDLEPLSKIHYVQKKKAAIILSCKLHYKPFTYL